MLNSTIDVIIPAYNAERFIVATLDSINAQTVQPTRIIVVNDGSSDGTLEVLKKYNSQVPLEVIDKENGGVSTARNVGLSEATADYVALVDADDLWKPEKLEKQLEVFANSEFKNLGVVYCDYELIDDSGKYTEQIGYFLDRTIRGNIYDTILAANKVAGSASAVLIKRTCLENVGDFDTSIKMGEDWDLWLRLAEKYEYDYAPEKLVLIRRHSASAQADPTRAFIHELQFYNKWAVRIAERKNDVKYWGLTVAQRIADSLPQTNLFRAVSELTPEAKRNLFQTTDGSLRKYVILVLLAKYKGILLGSLQQPVNVIKNYIHLCKEFIKTTTSLIKIIFSKN